MMNRETELQFTQLIGYAGSARSSYIKAIDVVHDPEKYGKLIDEGDECFDRAHTIHFELLQKDPEEYLSGILLMVHAEDQMAAAETFHVIALKIRELIQR